MLYTHGALNFIRQLYKVIHGGGSMQDTLILKGHILYTPNPAQLVAIPHGYIVAVDGVVVHCSETLPSS